MLGSRDDLQAALTLLEDLEARINELDLSGIESSISPSHHLESRDPSSKGTNIGIL